jgi:hypothetical protein
MAMAKVKKTLGLYKNVRLGQTPIIEYIVGQPEEA